MRFTIEGLGHPGVDWGSNANFDWFFGGPVDAAINVALNSNSGINCSALSSNRMAGLASIDRLGQCALCIVAEQKHAIGASDAALCRAQSCPVPAGAATPTATAAERGRGAGGERPPCCWDVGQGRCVG